MDRNIDQIVDYRAEYSSAIKGASITGDRLVGKCPFHADNKASFSADLKTGKWLCFSEDISGNFVTFWAKLYGVDQKEAFKQILQKYGRWEEEPPKRDTPAKAHGLGPYTLEEYARDKKLPQEFLTGLGVCTASDGKGPSYLKIPYFNEEQAPPVFRKRFARKEFRWSYGSAGKLILYGDWRMPEIRKAGKAILVEGESDTQTLWHMALPALGVPGASNIKPEHARKLDGLSVYIHVEPDTGGKTFLRKAIEAFREAGFTGRLYTWSCKQFGVKDPSDLYMSKGLEEATRLVVEAIQSAEPASLDDVDGLDGAPIRLAQPAGFLCNDDGVFQLSDKVPDPMRICRTPLLLTKRVRSLEDDAEKIEISFKRDGRWISAMFPRSTIFTTRGITALADLGCTITSESARNVVRYLGALEAENMDAIPSVESTSVLGWMPGRRFLPGHADGIILDVEPSLRAWAGGYSQEGSYEAWKADMGSYRGNFKFRFVMACAFAAPLLQIVRQRVFMVYNWGASRSGKTAGLKAAISVWGNPDRIAANFNATQVALERMAGFYHDLPMGIDERQLAGSRQEVLERIVYMLGTGQGKMRGSKAGGLQETSTWKTIVLATGEEPITTELSQQGVQTRILEIGDGPFKGDEAAGSKVYQQVADNFGWAGPEFIRHVLEVSDDWIREQYARMLEDVKAQADEESLSHAASIAVGALADAMADAWIFRGGEASDGIPDASWNGAVRMAGQMLEEQKQTMAIDHDAMVIQCIGDWILSNMSAFGTVRNGPCYGAIKDGWAYIYPSVLKDVLERSHYSYRQVLRLLDQEGWIVGTKEASGKKNFTFVMKVNDRSCRCIKFNLERYAKGEAKEKDEEGEDEDFRKVPEGSTPFDEKPAEPEGQLSLPYL